MELNKAHRESLLNELQKAKDDLSLQELIMSKRKDDNLVEWFETSNFLATERIKLIEQSLINNEIDF